MLHNVHRPQRRWYWPFTRTCACGLGGWPCRTQRRQAELGWDR